MNRKGSADVSTQENESVVHVLIVEVKTQKLISQKEKDESIVTNQSLQAVSITAGDKSGTSDAYCRVSLGKEKGKTRTIHNTLRFMMNDGDLKVSQVRNLLSSYASF